MVTYLRQLGFLVFALTMAFAHAGHAVPIAMTLNGIAQFDPPSLPGGGTSIAPFGIVSGQPMSLTVGFDDSLGDGNHEVSTATGITLEFVLGAPGMQVTFRETDDSCFDDSGCNEFLFITLDNGYVTNVSYVGSIIANSETYFLSVFRDLAESPDTPGFFFDWLLVDSTGTESLAGGLIFISEPGTLLMFGLGGLMLLRSRRLRRAQA